jgi:Trk K+ transport system NAD-binding subunit
VRRRSSLRALRLRGAVLAYVLRRLGPPVLAVLTYTLLAASLYRFEQRVSGRPVPDFGAAVYAIYTQLFFEPTAPFPDTPVARVLFALTPLAGVFLLAEGLLKVGASLFDLDARREGWVNIVSRQMKEHVVVCGLDHLGYRVVEELSRLGEEIVAIEQREAESFVDEVRALGIPVHLGDARRDEVLRQAGIEKARAVVCATGSDLTNLEIALDARKLNPRVRVVLRMFEQRLAGKVGEALDVNETFSTSALAAPLIALQATHSGVLSAYRVDEVVRVTAEVPVRGRVQTTVDAVEAQLPCRVVGRRGSGGLVPLRAGDAVSTGDRLVLDLAAADLPRVWEGLATGLRSA